MPEITQVMGFDAHAAIAEIQNLNTALTSLNNLLGSVGTAVGTWNAVGAAAEKQFEVMRKGANAARKAIEALNAAQTRVAGTGGAGGVGATRGPAAISTSDLNNYQNRLQDVMNTIGQIPSKGSIAAQKAFDGATSRLAQYVATTGMSQQQLTAAWNNGSINMGVAGAKMGKMMVDVQNAAKRLGTEGKAAVQGFGLSWEQMGMIVQATIVHSIINGILGLLREGIQTSIKFGKALADAVSISIDPLNATQQDITNLGEKMIEISNKYGESVLGTTEGFYQLMSARVGTATESMMVLEEAQKLAIITNTSLADTIKVTTAALNSYGMGAQDASRVTDILFMSVARGRYHLTELKDTLGKVLPLSHELGVGFEEFMAALDTMTVAGTRSDTATTQLRAVMTQLLKPTRELKELFQAKWGVQNAEEAIRLFGGMVPMMQALNKEAGNLQGMSEFFKNVRALAGGIAISGEHAKTLADNLKAISEIPAGAVDFAAKLEMETPAKKAEIAFNRIKNAFMEVSQAFLPAIANMVNALNSIIPPAEAILILFKAFIALRVGMLITGVASAFGLFATQAGAASAAIGTLNTTMLANPLLAAMMAGYAIGEMYQQANKPIDTEKLATSYKKSMENLEKLQLENVTYDARLAAIEERRHNDKLQKLQEYVSRNRLANRSIEEDAIRLQKVNLKEATTTAADIVKLQEKTVSSMQKLVDELPTKLLENRRNVQKLVKNLDDQEFQWKIAGMTKIQQISELTNRASQGFDKTRHDAMRANTEDEINRLRERNQVNIAGAQQAEQLTSEPGTHPRTQEAGREIIRKGMQTDIFLEERKGQIARQNALAAAKDLPEQTKNLDIMREATAELTESFNYFKRDGVAKTGEELAESAKKGEQAIQKIQAAARKGLGRDLNLAEQMGLLDAARQMNAFVATFAVVKVKVVLDLDKAKNQAKEFTGALGDTVAKAIEKTGEKVPTTSQEYIETYKKITENVKKNQEAIDKDTQALKNHFQAGKDYATGLEKYTWTATNFSTKMKQTLIAVFGSDDEFNAMMTKTQQTKDLWNQVVHEMQAAFSLDPQKPQTLKQMGIAIDDIKKKLEPLRKSGLLSPSDMKVLEVSLGVLVARAKSFEEIGIKGAVARQKELETNKNALSIMDKVNQQVEKNVQAFDAAKNKEKEIATIPVADPMMVAAQAADSYIAKLDTIIRKATQAAQIQPAQTQALGGWVRHLANGGGIGTDSVPVMLTPGEFVMNASASRRFYSQLVAMNSGGGPQNKATGGSVTNFGDINVSVKGGGSGQQTAREIATALRRELRRGTSQL